MTTPTPLITPIPGDPEQVRRVSAQLATVETRAREIESRLRAIETGVGPQMWRGQAADGFAALLAETGPDLTRLAASYGAASQALATYATELAAAQDAARAAAAEANTATGDRDQATADRDSAEADAARHAAAADEARLRLDPVAAQDADQRRGDSIGRASAAGAAIDQAERALRAARQKADEAAGQRDTAAARWCRRWRACCQTCECAHGGIKAAHARVRSSQPAIPQLARWASGARLSQCRSAAKVHGGR
ncbi:WXG100 family type VII secretion target [Pseudonocardia sp. DSM 110487]|nr:WXG100 family type VII secretion target [Pseudonocardia sp. DSM 110487]